MRTNVSQQTIFSLLIFLIIAVLVTQVFAATSISNFSVDNLLATYETSGDGSGSATSPSGTPNTITATAKGTSKWFGAQKTAQTLYVYITNNSSGAGTLTFTLAPGTNGFASRTVTVGDTEQSGTNNSYKIVLQPEAVCKITLITPKGNTQQTCDIQNISLTVLENNVNVTIGSPIGSGKILKSGVEASVGTTYEYSAGSFITDFTAEASSGYTFRYWADADGNKVGDSSGFSVADSNITLRPCFSSDSSAIFQVGGTEYYFWEDAVAKAVSETETIVLTQSGVLHGDESHVKIGNYVMLVDSKYVYSLPSTCKLLIPYNSSYTADFDAEPTMTTTYSTPSMYRCLTLAEGAVINCSGKINANAQVYVTSSRDPSRVSGSYGAIHLHEGSQLNMASGSELYAYGYIGGSGTVTAYSGAKVYEIMQLMDWRGGDNSSKLVESLKGYSFLFSQYYLQNIEAPFKIFSGSQVSGVFSVSAAQNLVKKQITGVIVGTNDGLFRMDASRKDDYILMAYDSTADRMDVELCGSVSTQSLDFSIDLGFLGGGEINLNTAEYIFSLPMNYTLTVKSGSNVTFNQKFKLMPGTVVNIEEGATATLTPTGALYLYDVDDWKSGNYTYNSNIYQVGYVYARNDAPVSRSVNTDAVLKVDGTAIANGPVYSTNYTENGGDACITGKGTVTFKTHGKTNLKEVNGSSTNLVEITCVPAVGTIAGYDGLNSFALGTYYGYDDGTSQYWYQFKTQMVLGSSLDLRIAIPEDIWKTGNKITISKPDGTAYTFTTGTPVAIPDSGNYYFFTFPGMAATEMAVPLTVSITSANGESIAAPFAESIQSYAMRMLNNKDYLDSTPTAQAMLVDMLNYGAAAQTYFATKNGTEVGTLPNSDLNGLTGTETNPFEGISADIPGAVYPAALRLGSKIELLVKFVGDNVTNAAFARVDFDSHWDEVTEKLSGQIYRVDDLTKDGDSIVVTVDRLLIADAAQPVTIALYDHEGNRIALATGSIQDYLQRTYSTTTDEALKNLCEATMKFSASAKKFLHERWGAPTTNADSEYNT